MRQVARTVRGRAVVMNVLLLVACCVAHHRTALPAAAEPVVGYSPLRCEGGSVQQIHEPGRLVLIDGQGDTCLRAEGSCQLSITAGAIGLVNCQECIRAEGNAEVLLSATGDISCVAFGHGIRAEGSSAVAVHAGGLCTLEGETGDLHREGEATVVVDCQGAPLLGGAPLLTQDPLIRGRVTAFQVTPAHPGELVWFFVSPTGIGLGPCLPELGGLCLDLLPPVFQLGAAAVDAAGTATLLLTVPPQVPLIDVHTQAAVERGVGGAESVSTTTVTAPILP
jgi:hypothetical protein